MLSFIKDKLTMAAAGTSLGQTYGIKPKLVEQIDEQKQEIDNKLTKILKLASVKKSKGMSNSIKKLKTQANNMTSALKSDKILDKISGIIGNHVSEYESVKAFQTKVENSKAVKKMYDFAGSLIDFDNYTTLNELLENAGKFKKLSRPKQNEIFEALKDGKLAEAIAQENESIEIDTVKANVKKMCQKLCTELNLKNSEEAKLIKIFDNLTTEFLPKFTKVRTDLLKHLPTVLKAEHDRILELCPHLAVEEAETEQKTLTTNFDRKSKSNTTVKEDSVKKLTNTKVKKEAKEQPTVNRKVKAVEETKVEEKTETKTAAKRKVRH